MLNYQQDTPAAPAYDDDFVLWLDAQVEFLRAGRYELLDKEHLLDELIAMTRHDQREIRSRLEKIIMHLLKCQYQPGKRTRSWSNTINVQRREVFHMLQISPSLRALIAPSIELAYTRAVREAARQTRLAPTVFPPACPYATDQLLDESYFP